MALIDWHTQLGVLDALLLSASATRRQIGSGIRSTLATAGVQYDLFFTSDPSTTLEESFKHQQWATAATASISELSAIATKADGGPPTITDNVSTSVASIKSRLTNATSMVVIRFILESALASIQGLTDPVSTTPAQEFAALKLRLTRAANLLELSPGLAAVVRGAEHARLPSEPAYYIDRYYQRTSSPRSKTFGQVEQALLDALDAASEFV